MLHFKSIDSLHLENTWLTIGTFDGVHRGHQAIIRQLTTGARLAGAQSAVLTFFPHPAITLARRQGPIYLTTPDKRATLLGELGVDVVITQSFTPELAALTADDFIGNILPRLGFRHLLVGYDFALGRGRQGNVDYLKSLGQQLGFTVESSPPIWLEGETVSSSQIRLALANGDVVKAGRLLNRPFSIEGPVIPGEGAVEPLVFQQPISIIGPG